MSLSAGTEPGTVASEMIEKMPSMARRPLLTSVSARAPVETITVSGRSRGGSKEARKHNGTLARGPSSRRSRPRRS